METGDSGQIEGEPKSFLNSLQSELPRERGLEVALHSRDFLDNIRARGTLRAHAEVMRRSHIACHTAAIAPLDFGTQVKNEPSFRKFHR